ncbi:MULTISPECIES: hypothetical protein [Enterococcus]|uniref:Uncharacterized protein n=1 Tax=Candidatus Enterococcus mangumiae TaxID=2230878 RepID=A0ABZ2SUT9_9ENTE|nr:MULTISPECIES: hypothetical protein [Enterococcus]AZP93486.1 hypothetical protein CYK55_10575 [Enterococcus mundtii]MBO0491253.1 hypothetical protein [Enterococcus sp. DIV1094]MBO1299146.1 hypothetical protein [Enterococcus sp. DIV1271a]MCA6773191.1 hypothetical protein [Enterococcus mundtii]MDA9427640.1 hypothetical protein [Enterococcus mundtii 1A]
MRNKEKFLEDYNKVVKPEFQNDENTIEDAAHTLNNIEGTTVTVAAEFTETGKMEAFDFEQKQRPKTDDPDQQMLDWYYVGRGEVK